MKPFRASLAIAALTLSALSAHAGEPSAEKREAAEKLFVEGRDADARGEHELACAKFRSSAALFPVPNAVANVARCAEREGRAVEALEAWRHVISLLPRDDPRVAIAEERAAILAAKVPRVTLVLPSDLPADARISIDDKPMARDQWSAPIPLAPGDHVIVVDAPGRKEQRFTVTLSDGDRKELPISAPPLPPRPPPMPPPPPPPSDGKRAAAWATLGIGAAGLGAAGITGALLLARDARIRELCPSRVCSKEGTEEIAGSKPLFALNGVAWGVGIAGAAAAVTLFALSRAPARAAIVPWALPGAAGASVGGVF